MKKIVIIVFMLFIAFLFSASNYSSKSDTPVTAEELLKIDPVLHPMMTSKSPAALVDAEIDVSKLAIDPAVVSRERDGTLLFSVIIRTEQPQVLINDGFSVNSILPGFVTARLSAGEIIEAARLQSVDYIGMGTVYYPKNDLAAGETGAALLNSGYVNNTEYKGSGVLICIIDTGIDWTHKDFRDPLDDTQSRILYIWDQTLTTNDPDSSVSGEQTPEDRDGVNFSGLNYGVEFSQADIEDEIDGSPVGFVREYDTNGHGTHVAGTAAGNGAAYSSKSWTGMAPEADIIVVKAGNGGFSSDNVIDALTYARKMSTTLNKPVVANLSLGGHESAHDGTGLQELAVDYFADAGRVAVVAAGNDGNDNIHFSGTVPASSTQDVTVTVSSYSPTGGGSNDYFGLVIWYDDATNINLTIDPPNIASFTYNAGSSGYYGDDTDGQVYVYNSIDGNYTNGDRKNRIYVYDAVEANAPAAGTWTLTLSNTTGSPVNFHGWLYIHSMSVSVTGANSQYTVGDPGTASEAITVAAYTSRWRWTNYLGGTYNYLGTETSDDIAAFSSIGPRRDGVQKPDIAAPGMGVVSSTSKNITPDASIIMPGEKHHMIQGTSMASPATAGTVALMLEANPNLTAAQIKSLITDNAFTDPYTGGSLPDYTWGYGKLDALKVVSEILNSASTLDREILVYDTWGTSAYGSLGPNYYCGVRFTPTISGMVGGVFFHPYNEIDITSPLYFEIWSDNGGLPNAKLGSTVSFDKDEFLLNSWNYLDISGTGATVSAGTSYHVVFYYTSGTNFNMFLDTGSVDGRSSLNSGGGWGTVGVDFRVRPVIVTGQDALLALKVFLEGPYDAASDVMTTALKTAGSIPTTSPYTEDARTVSSIPADITDWVLVQLRSVSDGAAVYSHSAFLRSDGRLVADNGTTTDVPLAVDAGDYFVVVKHRNHIAVMSNNTHTLSTSSSSLYDFTTALSQYEGGAAALLETGVYGMFSGNADNSNNSVDANDRAAAWNNRNSTGYQDSDCTLSGTVDANARTATWNNRNVTTNVP